MGYANIHGCIQLGRLSHYAFDAVLSTYTLILSSLVD